MSFKLDIFKLLGDIENPRAGDIYTKLTADEKKGYAPLVVMRWLSGTSDKQQIKLINEYTNPHVFALSKHPHLLLKLHQACSTKTGKRFTWLGIKGKKKGALAQKAVQEYYGLSTREVKLFQPFPPEEEVLQIAEELGWDKDELNKLKKEHKE